MNTSLIVDTLVFYFSSSTVQILSQCTCFEFCGQQGAHRSQWYYSYWGACIHSFLVFAAVEAVSVPLLNQKHLDPPLKDKITELNQAPRHWLNAASPVRVSTVIILGFLRTVLGFLRALIRVRVIARRLLRGDPVPSEGRQDRRAVAQIRLLQICRDIRIVLGDGALPWYG